MRIFTTSDVKLKLWTLIESIDTEVGGFGYGFLTDEKDLLWQDVFLVPQLVSGSEVAFDGDGITAAIERAATDDVLGQPGFVWVSWHSHHTMKAFWSSTDEDCIRTYGAAGVKHLLSFVGCHDHDYRMRLDFFGVKHDGFEIPQVTIGDLRLIADPLDSAFDAIGKEIAANVKKAPVKPTFVMGKRPSDPGEAVERALERRAALMVGDDVGDNGYFVGPAGLEYMGFDQMAWGD